MAAGTDRLGARRGHRVDRRDQDHSSSSSDSYSGEPRTPRINDDIGISSGDENSADDCVDEYVDDCGRRMNPRYENYEHEDGLRDGHRRNWGRSDDQQSYDDISDERQVFWPWRWKATGE